MKGFRVSNPMYPPPPPPPPAKPSGPAAKAPALGYLAVAGGVLGVLGLVLPWYVPQFSHSIDGQQISKISYHAWSGYFVLVAAPILLILAGTLWLQSLLGRTNSRFAAADNPLKVLGKQSVIYGAIALVLALLSFVVMKNHYKDWDQAASFAKSNGATLDKNPQIGLYLVILGALLVIAAGVIGLRSAAPVSAATPPFYPGPGAPGAIPPVDPAAQYAPQDHPTQYPPQNYAPQNYAPQDYAPQDYPTQGTPPAGYPPAGPPAQPYPGEQYPPAPPPADGGYQAPPAGGYQPPPAP